MIPDHILELVARAISQIDEDDDEGFYVIDTGELLDPTAARADLRDMLPEPNCNDPDCPACMALRRLRGETLESNPGRRNVMGFPKPSDGPPIII